MRKILLTSAVLAAASVLIIFLSLTSCKSLVSSFQEPKLSLQSVEIANINLDSVKMLCKVQVENPNGFDLPFPETDWEFFINAGSFAKGNLKNNHKVKARNSALVDVPVELKYSDVFASFKSLAGSKEVDYKVALGLKFPYPLIRDKVWTFEHEGMLPMPQLPRIRTPSMRMERADTTRAEINVTINVENPNPFELPMPKIEYDYRLNRNSFIKGNLENEGTLAANKVTPVTFKLIVNYADLFRNFASLLNAFQADSLLVITCDYGLPSLSSRPQSFEVSGTLPVLR